jgi:hypothetical protein
MALIPQPNGTLVRLQPLDALVYSFSTLNFAWVTSYLSGTKKAPVVQDVEEVRLKRMKRYTPPAQVSPTADPLETACTAMGPGHAIDADLRDVRPRPTPSRALSPESQNEEVGGQIFYTPLSSPTSLKNFQLYRKPSNDIL